MELIGIFIFGAIIGSLTTYLWTKGQVSDLIIQRSYLKNYISGLEDNAKQAKRKKGYKSSRRPSKKGGASRSVKGSSKA
jgi:hypothetical protein